MQPSLVASFDEQAEETISYKAVESHEVVLKESRGCGATVIAAWMGRTGEFSSSMAMTPKDREDFKLSLAVEALRGCGTVHLRAWGTSMLPSLWPGDLLTIQKATQEEPVPGDIVLVVRDKRCFIHRLAEKQASENGVCFITRGDAIPGADPPAGGAELLGKVINVRRGSRSFAPSQRISLVHSVAAYAFCRSDRVRNLALRLHAVRLQGWRPTGRTGASSLAHEREILSTQASQQ